jgi:alpha-methylacyl-CoA racemase
MTAPNPASAGVLAGVRIIEMEGIGPGPFAGMLLADMGADVILVERAQAPPGPLDLGRHAIVHRGKRSLALDLKRPESVAAVLRLVESADGLIEGMRPGVMERLGLGPEPCLARNPKLVYGRMTGWGQTGPFARVAGHDLNYVALSGAAWFDGDADRTPLPPATLIGDLGGGALYLALGIVAALWQVRGGGPGQVVDAAIVDGSANLMNLVLSLHSAGHMPWARGQGLLDGPYWYASYRCADGGIVTVGALEPQFNRLLLERLGLADDSDFQAPYDRRSWPRGRERLAALFASHPRAHWQALLEGTDACFAPLLHPAEAATHPHLEARGVYQVHDGVLQAAAAPRFSVSQARPGRPVPMRGAHGAELLREIGFSDEAIEQLGVRRGPGETGD